MKGSSRYHIRKSSGRIIDGLSKAELISMSDAGMIEQEDEIRKEGHRTWHPASAVIGLSAENKVSNEAQISVPKSESRAGKKLIIYGSCVAIVGLVFLGGVLLIWSAIQDLPRTSENIAKDVVATDTHAEDEVETIAAKEEENKASVSDTSITVSGLENIAKDVVATDTQFEDEGQNIVVKEEITTPIPAISKHLGNEWPTIPNGIQIPTMISIGGITVPRTGPIWVHEELQMPVIGGFVMTGYTESREAISSAIQPLTVNPKYTNSTDFYPQFYFVTERFGVTEAVPISEGTRGGWNSRSVDLPPAPDVIRSLHNEIKYAGLGCPVLSNHHEFSWMGLNQIIISSNIYRKPFMPGTGPGRWDPENPRTTITSLASVFANKKKENNRRKDEEFTYDEIKSPDGDIKQIAFQGERGVYNYINLVFTRDPKGRVIQVTEYTEEGNPAGLDLFFEYDSDGRFVKLTKKEYQGIISIEIAYDSNLVSSITIKEPGPNQNDLLKDVYLYSYDKNARPKDVLVQNLRVRTGLGGPDSEYSREYLVHFDYFTNSNYWKTAYICRGLDECIIATRINPELLGLPIIRSFSPEDSKAIQTSTQLLRKRSQFEDEEAVRIVKETQESKEKEMKATVPLTKRELLAYLNLFSESVTNMKNAVDAADARSLLSALEGIQETMIQRDDEQWQKSFQAFVYTLQSAPGSEIDVDVLASMNKFKQSRNLLFRYIRGTSSDKLFTKKFKNTMKKIESDPKLLQRFLKVDLTMIRDRS